MPIIVAPASRFAPAAPVPEFSLIFGDSDGTLATDAAAQAFHFRNLTGTLTFGDADILEGSARGGDDRFFVTGFGPGFSQIKGDAELLQDRAVGGDDVITARGGQMFVVGDSAFIEDQARGGDDRVVTRDASRAALDALSMSGDARGGDDRLEAYGGIEASGDGDDMDGRSRGGDDRLRVFGDSGHLAGDAMGLRGSARGGDDVLTGGGADDSLWGDARFIADDHAICGDDVLDGRRGDDLLFGDAPELGAGVTVGNDRFVFAARSGRDIIGDFQQGHDRIDVRALGYQRLSELDITRAGGDSVVHFEGPNQVTVEGVAKLVAADFLFA